MWGYDSTQDNGENMAPGMPTLSFSVPHHSSPQKLPSHNLTPASYPQEIPSPYYPVGIVPSPSYSSWALSQDSAYTYGVPPNHPSTDSQPGDLSDSPVPRYGRQLVPPIVPHHTSPTSQFNQDQDQSSLSSQSSLITPTMPMPMPMPNLHSSYVNVAPFTAFQNSHTQPPSPHWTYNEPRSNLQRPISNPQLQPQWPSYMPMTRDTPGSPYYTPAQHQGYTQAEWQAYESTTYVHQSPSMGAQYQMPAMGGGNSIAGQYPGSSGPGEGRRKGVCIGINYFSHEEPLRGCINDARRVRDFLINNGGYRPENIILLTDDSQDPRWQPNRQNILDAMRWLVQDPHPNDRFFFQFSGHGGLTKDLNHDERSGWDSVIYPMDGGQIIDDDMHEIMVKPLPKGCRLTGLFDACHSGTALDLPYVYSTRSINGFQKTFNSLIDIRGKTLKASPADVISWSACKDHQSSADAPIDGGFAGAMNHAFITSLKSNPHQTYRDLLLSVRSILQKRPSQIPQVPQLACSHKIDTRQKVVF